MVKAREIKEIRKNEPEGQYRFRIIKTDEGYRISAYFKPNSITWHKSAQVNFPVMAKRLIQLANEILNHFKREAEWKEWKPTMQELEMRLEECYEGKMYDWITGWLRHPKNKKYEKQLYEWLKEADRLGAFKE